MTDKELKRLSRRELLEIMIELKKQLDETKQQNRELQQKLIDFAKINDTQLIGDIFYKVSRLYDEKFGVETAEIIRSETEMVGSKAAAELMGPSEKPAPDLQPEEAGSGETAEETQSPDAAVADEPAEQSEALSEEPVKDDAEPEAAEEP